MTEAEIRRAVLAALRRVAPEIDPAKLDAAAGLREQADIDSVDFLRFLVAIHAMLDVDIPESDYAQLQSLDGCVRYIAARLAEPSGQVAPVVGTSKD
jgi:acyl carrier protein